MNRLKDWHHQFEQTGGTGEATFGHKRNGVTAGYCRDKKRGYLKKDQLNHGPNTH
jgi:hypothetical protein